jgi:hypothetical protein
VSTRKIRDFKEQEAEGRKKEEGQPKRTARESQASALIRRAEGFEIVQHKGQHFALSDGLEPISVETLVEQLARQHTKETGKVPSPQTRKEVLLILRDPEAPERDELDVPEVPEPDLVKMVGHLVNFALEDYDFLLDERGDLYAIDRGGPQHIVLPLDDLRYRLAARYFREMGTPASTSAWPEAKQTIIGLHLDSPRVQIRNRFTRAGNRTGEVLFIDLGTEDYSIIVVSAKGWQMFDAEAFAEMKTPIYFRRPRNVTPMAVPEREGSLEELRELFQIDPIRFGLVIGWLISVLRADIPAPVVVLLGEQGTGKSTLARFLGQIIDPGAPLGRPPSGEERLQNAAINTRVYGIDNLSHIAPWFSDALSAAVTGETDKRRKLYTDADPFWINLLSAVLLTGISIEGGGPDLLERMVTVHLDVIPKDRRRPERELKRWFEQNKGKLLGAVLDLTVKVLKHLDDDISEHPRMADYGAVLYGLDKAKATTGVFAYYTTEAPKTAAAEIIEANLFAGDLVKFLGFDKESYETAKKEPWPGWTGTAQELHDSVAALRYERSTAGKLKIPKADIYPHTANETAGSIKRLAPTLRVLGYEWTPPKELRGRERRREHTFRSIGEQI